MTDDYEIDIDDGAGCAELWEYTALKRRSTTGGEDDDATEHTSAMRQQDEEADE